jgi:predicted oxidoreductase
MSSVFGGHAVMSEGGLSLVGTPEQEARKIEDSPQLASKDFIAWGDDVNAEWVSAYVTRSRPDVRDWLADMGVQWRSVVQPPGNSVPRFHSTVGQGLGLVVPLYRAALQLPNIRFAWNVQITKIDTTAGKVSGASGIALRNGSRVRFTAANVVVATGGFENNLKLVKANWPRGGTAPQRVLRGSGKNSMGYGLGLGRGVGAAIRNLDYQWIYPAGFPDPRTPDENLGLNVLTVPGIWVNATGRRFVNEVGDTRTRVASVEQLGGSFWAVFDDVHPEELSIAGTDWGDPIRRRKLANDPKLVTSGETITELANKIGVSPGTLSTTVEEWNQAVNNGRDQFGVLTGGLRAVGPARTITKPPFHAMRVFLLARKSMGGLAVNLRCQVLNRRGEPIKGLYAVGEATGFGGINGKAALEGTFLGPSILMGRVAGREISVASQPPQERSPVPPPRPQPSPVTSESKACESCHPVSQQIAHDRPGYWHFKRAHMVVLERKYECTTCHAELHPFRPEAHRITATSFTRTCSQCHGLPDRK